MNDVDEYCHALQASVDELWKRGVDETTRRIRGRVLVEIRCRPRGHRLADVYPSSHGPVLVSMVENSLSDPRSARTTDASAKVRDPWLVPADWYVEEGGVIPSGVMSAYLLDWPAVEQMVDPPQRLLCRCGQRPAPTLTALRSAAHGNTRRVFT